MIQRDIIKQLRERINEPRKFIQVLFGPRQVGKTTLVSQLLEETDIAHSYASADAVATRSETWLMQIWESARLKMKTQNIPEFLLVIDEIQKINNWSEIIKQQWDKDSFDKVNIKLILLGSSRVLLQQGLTESLAGRFETLYIGHWSFSEMQNAFDWSLEQYIYFGGYPGAADLISQEERWKSYIQDSLIATSISKDILMLTRVDKPALLKQLFELGCHYSGQILSYNKMLGQLQDAGNTTTLANYLTLLSDSGLLKGLEKYAGNVVRKRASSPKYQVYNNALITAQSTDSFLSVVADAKKWGRLVESAIGAHLVNYSITEKYQVYYWRASNYEVDFVIERGDSVVGLEVKSGGNASNKGMSIFSEKFKPKNVLIVGTNGIPLSDFLQTNPIEFL